MQGEHGFSLVEMLVVVGIIALLGFGAATMTMALRPNALRAATYGFDASLAAARAIAATSGNGATIVFARRTDPQGGRVPGFTMTVYRGRPRAAAEVTPTTVMPLVSDADVSEATVGTPPFSIFLSSAGHPYPLAAYPTFSNDKPQFNAVATQPACPAGGVKLTFMSTNATQRRVLSCDVAVWSSPHPLATASPAPIVLTPSSLVFYWPSASQQQFVATEWGYTRYFAADSFACGKGVATYPQSGPAPPYSPADSPQDASADPLPPATQPYSFAYSTQSMEDAPAAFPVSPSQPGTCASNVADVYGQAQIERVQVMGPLTASPPSLSWGPSQGNSQNVVLGKTFDNQTLQPRIANNTCNGITNASFGATWTPPLPEPSPAVATLTVAPLTNGPGGSCAITVVSQYSGEPAVMIGINVATPRPAPTTSPAFTPTPSSTPTPVFPPPATPTPSAKCTPDPNGLCGVQRSAYPQPITIHCVKALDGSPWVGLVYYQGVTGAAGTGPSGPYTGTWSSEYDVYSAANFWTFTITWYLDPDPCQDGFYVLNIKTWDPADPRIYFSDPFLQ